MSKHDSIVIRLRDVIGVKTGCEFRGIVFRIGLRKCGNDFDDTLIVSYDPKLIPAAWHGTSADNVPGRKFIRFGLI